MERPAALEKKPTPSGAPGEEPVRVVEREDTGRGAALRCKACGFAITTDRARIEIGGAHQHDFMNPAGVAFRIGCFSTARGCVGVGEESTEWAWFPHHAWRIALCGGCFTHLGWSFRGASSSFHGLILDKLIEDEARR
jgi:hypothetical protein